MDTITEGIGINNRLTVNFEAARVDGAFRGTDREAVEMAAYLMRNEGTGSSSRAVEPSRSCAMTTVGLPPATLSRPPVPTEPKRTLRPIFLVHPVAGLFVGSSSAMNCVGAVKAACRLGPGHTIVTVLCDSGQRHMTKFWSPAVLAKWGLTPVATGRDLDWIGAA